MPREFVANLTEVFTGSGAGYSHRWSACDFFDKAVFAQISVAPQYWPGSGNLRTLPGLPDGEYWDGVESISGHLVLWRGDTIKSSDLNDFSMWIPVAQTAVSLRATTTIAFTQPATGSSSDWIYTDSALNFVEGQYVRVEKDAADPTTATYNFYEVSAVGADSSGISADTVDFEQVITAGQTAKVYTSARAEWGEGNRIVLDDLATTLEVVSNSSSTSTVSYLTTATANAPSISGTVAINLEDNSSKTMSPGDIVSLSAYDAVGKDIYEVSTVGNTIRVTRLGLGTSQRATGNLIQQETYITPQPYVEVVNTGASSVTIPAGATLTAQSALKVKALGLTGEVAAGTTFPVGTDIQSVDSNEAAEFRNAGAQINGDVFAIVALGEYGVILKNRSIQSMQYVGKLGGIFVIRPEIQGEGPIARNAWVRVAGESTFIVFCGNNNLYVYSGGSNLTPVCPQHSQQLLQELDRSRADEITFFHNEVRFEVWMVYPSLTGETKVFVYNYREDTATVDTYSSALGGISAIGSIDWEDAPTWSSLLDSQIWDDETLTWREYVDVGLRRYTIIGVAADDATADEIEDDSTREDAGVPRLLAHDRGFSRSSQDNCTLFGYTCTAETKDFDFGDDLRFKYIDTVLLNIEIESMLDRPKRMFVQLGARDNLDSDIRWTDPAPVEVSGNGMRVTKANARAAGRFIRVRFFSEDPGVSWRIAGFRLIGRPGGLY